MRKGGLCLFVNWPAVRVVEAFFLLLVFHYSAPCLAQIEVEVIDLSNGRNIPARISLVSDSGSIYIGDTTEEGPLVSDMKCENRIVEAKLLYPFWQYNSIKDRQKKCVTGEKIPIYFRPIGSGAAGLVAPVASTDLRVFSTVPEVFEGIQDLEQSIDSGEFAEISVKAKGVAELLEEIQAKAKAEEYWLLSAQSAIAAMSKIQGKDQVKVWVRPSGTSFAITSEGRQVIAQYQRANGLKAIGQIDQQTFSSLAKDASGTR